MAVQTEPVAWPVLDIIWFSDKYGGTFIEKAGKWSHAFPELPVDQWGNPTDRNKLIREIMPHLVARAAELKEYFRLSNPDARAEETGKEYRARIVRDLQDAARLNGRNLYYADEFPRYELKGDGASGIPDTATAAVIAGVGAPVRDAKGKDVVKPFHEGGPGKWTPLPYPLSWEAADRRQKLMRAKKRLRKKQREAAREM